MRTYRAERVESLYVLMSVSLVQCPSVLIRKRKDGCSLTRAYRLKSLHYDLFHGNMKKLQNNEMR